MFSSRSPGGIEGRVYRSNLSPAANVFVKARTDEDGRFYLGSLRPGDYVLWTERRGFVDARARVRVEFLGPGEYEFGVAVKGYRPARRKIVLAPDSVSEVVFSLEKN